MTVRTAWSSVQRRRTLVSSARRRSGTGRGCFSHPVGTALWLDAVPPTLRRPGRWLPQMRACVGGADPPVAVADPVPTLQAGMPPCWRRVQAAG